MKIFIAIALTVFSLNAFAVTGGGGGDHAGNGGDSCENSFNSIKANIKNWIEAGGDQSLTFPAHITPAQYHQTMLTQIAKAKVSCTNDKVYVGLAEKTCKNYIAADGTSHILCNFPRFLATSEPAQYVLVHHEYAGLSGFEVNKAELSNYEISNQFSYFVEDQIIKKLGIIPKSLFDSEVCSGPRMGADSDLDRLIPPGIDSRMIPKLVIATFNIHTRERACDQKGCAPWALVPNRRGFSTFDSMPERGSIILDFDSIPQMNIMFYFQSGVSRTELKMWLDCGSYGAFDGTCSARNSHSHDVEKATGTITGNCAWLKMSKKDEQPDGKSWTERENVFSSRF